MSKVVHSLCEATRLTEMFAKAILWTALWVLLTTADGKSLWSSKPAQYDNIIREAYPIGNGRLGGG